MTSGHGRRSFWGPHPRENPAGDPIFESSHGLGAAVHFLDFGLHRLAHVEQ